MLSPQLLRYLQYAGVPVDAVQIIAGEYKWSLCLACMKLRTVPMHDVLSAAKSGHVSGP